MLAVPNELWIIDGIYLTKDLLMDKVLVVMKQKAL